MGCQTAAPPPAATPATSAAAGPLLSIARAACGSPAPATFSGRGADVGYVGYRTCSGVIRNDGAASASVDVWIDALDAEGRAHGACRRPLGPIAAGTEREWEATCPVTATEVGFSVRLTDPAGTPLPMRSP